MYAKILYAKTWNTELKKEYNMYIYVKIDENGEGRKISKEEYENYLTKQK